MPTDLYSFSLSAPVSQTRQKSTHLDDVQSLVDGGLGIEGETGINLSRHLSWDDLQDLLSEFNQEAIEGCIGLLVDILAVVFAVRNRNVYEPGIFWLLGCGKDEGWVGCSILRLVLANC
jgi:hypothetical protein